MTSRSYPAYEVAQPGNDAGGQHGCQAAADDNFCRGCGLSYLPNYVKPDPTNQTYWELKGVRFDGMPFQLVGTKTYDCHQGPDRAIRQKERYRAQKDTQALQDHVFLQRRQMIQPSKKRDCPVKLQVVQVLKFPGFKITDNTKSKKREASKALKAEIAANPGTVESQVQFHTVFPSLEEHKNHPVVGPVAELREGIDPRVEQLIVNLTLAGARKLSEIRRHLVMYVEQDLFRDETPPPQTRRRYHPTDQDIRNIMTKAKESMRESNNDQANVQILASRWEADSSLKFRPSTETTQLLFCYQTGWQKRLMHIYGQQMCLLDATYRTCRYSVPLFFLCVRANVSYVVVGLFIVQEESIAAIKEALHVFKDFNPNWHPSHFMVDFSSAEIAALEEEFQESKVLLCDFHREKAWVQWCRKRENGVADVQDALLKLLRGVAGSTTQDEYYTRLVSLQDSVIWKENAKLRAWFSDTWLPEAKRWVHVFRDDGLQVAIYTNNGIERQNETLKYSHLQGFRNCSLSELLTRLVTDFLPRAHLKYTQLNVRSSSLFSEYDAHVPKFLWDRPRGVVSHIRSRLQEALLYQEKDVTAVSSGTFNVKSESKPTTHHVRQNKTKLRRECASILREVTDLTYHLQDETYLEHLKEQLTNIKDDMRQHVPHDDTLPLTLTPKKRKAESGHETELDPGQSGTLPIKRVPQKHPFTKRVGHHAETMRANFRVSLNLETVTDKEDVSVSMAEVPITLSDEDEKVDNICPEDGEKKANTGFEHFGKTMLNEGNKNILQTGQWLTDRHINCAQQLLKNEYPFIEGFNDTITLAHNQAPVPASAECIQAHHVEGHWVLSTSVGGNITVYDSLRPSMKHSLRQQLVGLYRRYANGENCVIPVTVICAQTQRGGNDCGLFAVANAVALAEGISPMDISFKQSSMRLHLEECFATGRVEMFPHEKARQTNTQKTTYQLSTFCKCLEYKPRSPMIQCDSCEQWFHYRCVKLTAHNVASMVTEDEYICPTCQA
ncbi:hypothetical protein Bbelb_202870 [Branchiostoma belcheri]|nr:hypothetical protein Bbelb_202870 [Branchiostoma belcheri]